MIKLMYKIRYILSFTFILFSLCITQGLLKDQTSKCDPTDKDIISKITEYLKEFQDDLSDSDIKLIKFIAGECAPIIFLPGLYATKFQIHITNCTELNIHHPQMAKSCGYDKKCKDNDESQFWLSETFAKMDNKTCFGEISKIDYIFDKEKKTYVEQQTRGFKLTFYGNTPKTLDKNMCGFGACTNLFDNFFVSKWFTGALEFKKRFEAMGYQIGLNLFSVPTDWRKHTNDEYNLKLIKETIDFSFEINKKPALLIGHSMGVLNSLSFLYNMDTNYKNEKIGRFIALGPPFMGVSYTLKAKILGYEGFNMNLSIWGYDIFRLYLSMENQKIYEPFSGLGYDLLPKFTWENHKNENWFKLLFKRSDIENEITECVKHLIQRSKLNLIEFNDELVKSICINPKLKINSQILEEFSKTFPFFPDLVENCEEKKIYSATCLNSECSSVWDSYCRLNFHSLIDNYILKVQDQGKEIEYKVTDEDNYIDLILKYGLSTNHKDFIKFIFSNLNKKLNTLDHPNVPLTIIYSSAMKTTTSFNIPVNPRKFTDKNEFVESNLGINIENFGGGDQIVESASALIPALKWGYLFDNKKPDGIEKPVHLVDYCSNKDFKSRNSLINEKIDYNKNMFFNIACKCSTPSYDCSHSTMDNDENVLNFMENYVLNPINSIKDTDKLNSSIDLVKRQINHSEKINCSNLKLFQ